MAEQDVEIVIVEDNPGDAELTILALKKINLDRRVLHLSDGAEALDYMFRQGVFEDRPVCPPPKVIFLDLKMPRVDGLEVLEQIKANEQTRSVPVVILTSSAEETDIQRAYALGANSFIVKPVDFEEFSHTVASLGTYWTEINKT